MTDLICGECHCVGTEQNPVTIVNDEKVCDECMADASARKGAK